ADLSLEAMLRDLDAVAGQAGIDRFALLGFYNSCTHAIAYAALHPERVTRLILFGGSARGWLAMSAPETQALLSLIERDWGVFVVCLPEARRRCSSRTPTRSSGRSPSSLSKAVRVQARNGRLRHRHAIRTD